MAAPNLARRLASEAETLRRSRDWLQAEERFSLLMDLEPEAPRWSFRRAEALARLGRGPEASRLASRLVALAPAHRDLALVTARVFGDSGLPKEAEWLLQRIAGEEGETPDLLATRARLRRVQGDETGALADCVAALALDAGEPKAQQEIMRLRRRVWDRAGRLLERGRESAALALIDRHLGVDSGAAGLLALRAHIPNAPPLAQGPAPVATDRSGVPGWLASARDALTAGRSDIAEMLIGEREDESASPAVLAFTARAALMAGRAGTAAARYRRLIELDPADETARRGLGRALALAGDVEGAQAIYEALAASRPDDPMLLLESARLADRRPDRHAALAAWERVLVASPKDVEAALGRLAALEKLGRGAEADSGWKKLVAAVPDEPQALGRVARAALRDRRLPQARRVIQRLRKLAPEARDTLLLWSRLNSAEEKVPTAVSALRRLVAKEPRSLDLRIEMGRLYARARRWQEAADEFQSVLNLAPERTDIARALAQAWGRVGLPHLGEEMWRTYLDARPTEFVPLLGLLRSLMEKGDKGEFLDGPEIEQIFDLVRREHGEKPEAMIEEARFYMLRRVWKKARAIYERVLELDPERADAQRGLAHAWMQTGEAGRAAEFWRGRLAQRADDIDATINLARALGRAGDRAEFVRALEEAFVANADDDRVLTEFVQALADHPRTYARGVKLAREWRRRRPQDIRPLTLLSRITQRHGDLRLARAYAQRACDVSRDSLVALERRLAVDVQREAFDDSILTGRLILLQRPWDVFTGVKVAQALLRLDRVDEAIDMLESFTRRHAGDIWSAKVLARAYYRLARIEDTVRTLRACTEAAPNDVESWRELVVVLARADREAEALEAFAAAREALAGQEGLDLALGRILDRAQFEAEAEPFYEAAAFADLASAEPLEALGDMHRREGVLDGALHAYVRARDRDPRSLPIAMKTVETMEALASIGEDPVRLGRARPAKPILIPERLYRQFAEDIAPHAPLYEPAEKSVVLVNGTLAPGGAERQLTTTVEGLAQRRDRIDRVDVFCQSLDPNTRRDFYLPQIVAAGVTPSLPSDAAAIADHPLVRRHGEFLSRFPADMPTLAAWMVDFAERRPACVHAWQDLTNLAVVVAAVLAGVPRIVLGTRSVRPDNRRRRLRRWMQDAYKAIVDLPQVAIIGNSRNGADDYADWLGVDPARIGVIYNGYPLEAMAGDVDAAALATYRAELKLPPGARVMGGVFRMSEEKRPLLWVEAAAEVAKTLPDVHFVVCGDGPFFQRMIDLGAELGIGGRLHLVGSRRDISTWYAMFDALLLASRHEGLPNVVIEAQNAGVPVVVPRVGGAPEVVDDGRTGFLVPDADAASLAARLVTCLDDAAWREKALQEGPRFVRSRFGLDQMIENTLNTYRF